MSAKPNMSLNERTKHSSSTFMVSVSVPSMSNMTRCMGKWPNETKLSDRYRERKFSSQQLNDSTSQLLFTPVSGSLQRLGTSPPPMPPEPPPESGVLPSLVQSNTSDFGGSHLLSRRHSITRIILNQASRISPRVATKPCKFSESKRRH